MGQIGVPTLPDGRQVSTLLEYQTITSHGSTFAACVRDISRPSEPSAYSWLVWGPRAFQREGESASRLGAWERIEAAVRYGAEIVGR